MRIAAAMLLVLFLVPTWSGLGRLQLPEGRPAIMASAVVLDPADPARRRVGRLTYLGGVALRSPDPSFGGYSAMAVAGDRFTLLSDGGIVARFRLDRRWRITEPSFTPLPAGPGTGWLKEDRDSESLSVDPATGLAWVGFERANAIWRYSLDFTRWERRSRPPAMRDWPEAGGAESLARMPGGGFVAVSETGLRPDGGRRAVWFQGDPTVQPLRGFHFTYVPPAGYDPSDAAALPDGRLLVLNRRFQLPFRFTAKLTLVDRGAIRPGARVKGREIATLAPPLIHDNYEALAVTREGGDTILWIASDDNDSMLERTLLLKFKMDAKP